MEYVLICCTALAASALTLFSGFGLGTLLFPAFALFFPVDVAIAQTALVHLANNAFKLALFWRKADWKTVLAFGLPAIPAALAGAWLLGMLSGLPSLARYELWGTPKQITVVKLVMAGIMSFFAVAEVLGGIKKRPMAGGLAAGGLLSGFFGGLSGHQGAFRSAYLLAAGLSKEAFIATGVVLACLVDTTRIALYARQMGRPEVQSALGLILAASAAAFLGAFLGRRLAKKITMLAVRRIVSAMLFAIAAGLACGVF